MKFTLLAIFLLFVELSTSTNGISQHRQPARKKDLIYAIKKENWFNALKYCHTQQSELVSLKTFQEELELMAFLKKKGWDLENIWTAGNDLGTEDTFLWMSTGEKFVDTGYTNWAPNRTNTDLKNCVHLDSQAKMTWNIAACTTTNYFVCEKS